LKLFLEALFGLLAYDIVNALCPFRTVHGLVKDWKVSGRTCASDTIDRVSTAVNCACVWYPKRALCLQRAFVTTYLLRKSGIRASMVLGAQKLPFKAHAWVEVEGRVVNERSNVQGIYAVWDRC
jgi:hypothetical protein